jgi:hypothetical protein
MARISFEVIEYQFSYETQWETGGLRQHIIVEMAAFLGRLSLA